MGNKYICGYCGGDSFHILPASCRIACIKCRYMYDVGFSDKHGAELIIRSTV
jgi:hypothetical protein